VTSGGPAEWVLQHQDVQLRPVEERDLGILERVWTDPALSEPFEWRGYRDPTVHRHRWEQDHYLGQQDSMLVVAPPGQDLVFGGFVVWRAVLLSGPVVCYNIGILLLPDHRGHGLGSAAQCLLADYLFSSTLANRIEAGTEAENIAEQRALEKAGFQREGLHRGRGYRQGRMVDGLTYARLRSDPHP
jgi:RimJ/RimL family protein N-acetyltransferase